MLPATGSCYRALGSSANFDLVWVAKKERKKKKKKRKKEKKEKKKEEFSNDLYTDLICHSLLFLEIYL